MHASRACDACRRRKVRCLPCAPSHLQGPDAQCARCLQADIRCTYQDQRRKRGPKTGSVLKQLRAQQEAMSKKAEKSMPAACRLDVHQQGSPSSLTNSTCSPPTASSSSAETTYNGELLEGVGAATPMFSYMAAVEQYLPSIVEHECDGAQFLETEEGPTMNSDSNVSVHMEEELKSEMVDISLELVMSETREFLTDVYQRYPLWHLESFISRVNRGDQKTDHGFRLSCYSMFLMNEAGRFRKNPLRGTRRLMILIDQIRSRRRQQLDFAQNPSCDDIIQSLTMFVAYSVCDEHNLAFYYLNEASGLLRLVDPTTALSTHEAALYWRLEAILFVTESASLSIYGKSGMKRMIPCPQLLVRDKEPMTWEINDQDIPESWLPACNSLHSVQALDSKSIDLLQALVRLYSASDTKEIMGVSVPRNSILDIIEATNASDTSIQEADVNLTQQWLLCQRWDEMLSFPASSALTNSQKRHPVNNSQAAYLLQNIGLSGLQQIKSLDRGQCRLVGHGKLASLSTSIFNVASTLGVLAQCTPVISELIHAVYDLDHERNFAPELCMIQSLIEGVPQPLRLPDVVGEEEMGSQWREWEGESKQGT